MSLVAALPVHDEAGTVERALRNLREFCDPIIVLDVGSTDGAAEIARDFGAEVHKQEWRGFGPCNERLLELARGRGDYVFMAAATETVEQTAPLPALTAPVYMLKTWRAGSWFYAERIYDLEREWHCDGPVHTAIQPPYFDERESLDSLVVWQHDDDGRRTGKLLRYRDELEAWLATHPRDPRSLFYLGTTYGALGAHHAAAGVLKRRAEMETDSEEGWYALYAAGAHELACDFEQGALLLVEAFRRRRNRMEPLYLLERACRDIRAQFPQPPLDALLFVEPEAYQ